MTKNEIALLILWFITKIGFWHQFFARRRAQQNCEKLIETYSWGELDNWVFWNKEDR